VTDILDLAKRVSAGLLTAVHKVIMLLHSSEKQMGSSFPTAAAAASAQVKSA